MPYFLRSRPETPRRRTAQVRAEQALGAPGQRPKPQAPRLKPVICHVFPWSMTVGGAQAFVLDLAGFAARAGADVHLIHLGGGAPYGWADPPVGMMGHPVKGPDEARRVVLSLAPDLIHQHFPATSWGVKGLERKFPIVGTPHNWSQNIDPKLPDWAVPIAGPRCRIRHGIDLDLFSPRPFDGRGVPSPARRGEGPLRVGIVGRMHKDKYPDSFLDALARWRPAGVRLVCAGRGLAIDPIVERIERRLRASAVVDVLGDVPRARLPEFYRSIDVLLVPTVTESVCLAAIEAMACGVPVVGRAGSGLHDTCGEAGEMCDSDAAMLAFVENLAVDRAMLAAMASFARHRAETHFDQRRMFAEYATIYTERTGGRVDLRRNVAQSPSAVQAEPALGDPGPTTKNQKPPCSISVLMPVYRVDPKWFDDAVCSVLQQQGVPFELLIVLDGPDDRRIVQAAYDWALSPTAVQNGSVRVVVRPHAGVAASLNAGLRECRAGLVARFDADDVMPAGRLAAQVAYFAEHPETDLLCGDMTGFDGTGRTWPMRRPAYDPAKPLYDTWMNGGWNICHPTVCFRRDRVIEIGGYDETLPVAEDLGLWCRMQRAGYVIAKTADVWNQYRVHEGQQVAKRDLNLEVTKQILARYRAMDVARSAS